MAEKRYTKNDARQIAAVKLWQAVQRGIVIRPEHCQFCGAKGKLHAHHHEYNRPLEVDWFCPTCHKQYHKWLNNPDTDLRDLDAPYGMIFQR